MIDVTETFMENHPEYTLVAPASLLYNCHGFAYSVFQGGEKCQITWDESLCTSNGSSLASYIEILASEAQPDDIVTAVEQESWGDLVSRHSAIVINEDTLLSKWGNFPLFKHHKNDPWLSGQIGLTNNVSHYVYYRRNVNANNSISGPSSFNGSGTFTFTPNVTPTTCIWSVEPAAMFQVSSGTGYTANLSYKTPFEYLAPKATITFTFNYGCDNHYTATKEIDLRIPTTTISGNIVSDGFVIDANAVVTITGTIKNCKNAKTIVPVGSRLIIDGGTMTSNGEVMWQGIEVWGDKNMHQFEVNGSYYQGYLKLIDGAVIENAISAVELWRPGYYSTTGGIIHATDATFLNNTKSAHALWYTNTSYANGRETDYNSYFRNCTFVIDEDYMGAKTFFNHVNLLHVNGIAFSGCSFSVNRYVQGVSLYCVGIRADETGFTVGSYCDNSLILPCPDANLVRSSFYGFYQGIHAANDGSSTRAFSVRDAVFNNNTIGIYALNTYSCTILNNTFTVGCGFDCDFGIYAEEASHFCIEDNIFQPRAVNTGTPYGIAIVNSNGINDIYNNSFNNLRCGNMAIGDNTAASNQSTIGLTYTCNSNMGNDIDFCVLKDGNSGDIATQQGSLDLSAANTFGGNQYHFYNDGTHWVDYYYKQNQPGQTPNSSLLHRVSLHQASNNNSCLSHYGGGPITKTASEKAALESEYLSAHSTYNNLRQLYESRIDGGSTSTQVADINHATSADMWRLRTQLLGISPYVSSEVLTTAADRYDVFSDPILFEILAANPDELKNDSLINYLENKEHPMPAYMTDLLRQIASGFSTRTALIAQMAQYNHSFSLAAGDIVRSNLNDSIANPSELRTWLGNMEDIASDRMIIASYLQEGDSTHAFTLANMLPELYDLRGDALSDHEDYLRLINLYQTLNRESRTVFELTEAEIAMVSEIASSGSGTSKAMAETLLMERSDEAVSVISCPTLPQRDEGRGTNKYEDVSLNEALGFTVNVTPNPASTWVTVEYTLPADAVKATLRLTNALGVAVASYDLFGGETQKVLDLRSLTSGVYIYTVLCGKLSITNKLVIVK